MNLGIRAHDIEKLPLEELVAVISKKGLTSVQLALGASFDELNPNLGLLSPGLAHRIGSAFRKNNIQIAILGCYINMIHPDKEERKKSLDRFKEHIRYARDFGCSIVGTETGNVNAEIVYTEDNFHEGPFQEVLRSTKELVEEAEKFGVIVGVEAGVNHPIYSAKVMRRLLDSIDSQNIQVILDPVNLLTADTYQNQDEIIKEAFELLDDRIAVMHAKDFIIENNELKFVAVGQGLLNYDLIFELLKKRKPHINILLEETQEPFIDSGMEYIKEKYNKH